MENKIDSIMNHAAGANYGKETKEMISNMQREIHYATKD